MNVKPVKAFLHVSNAIISVTCVIAAVCYLMLPVFTVNVRTGVSKELIAAAVKDQTSDTARIAELAVQESGDEGLTVRLSFNLRASMFIGSIFGGGRRVVYDAAGEAAEQAVSSVEDLIDRIVPGVVRSYSRSVLKSQIVMMANDNVQITDQTQLDREYDRIMDGLGSDGRQRAESLLQRIVNAVTAEDSTVDSVIATVTECIDEAERMLRESDEYAPYVNGFDGNAKNELISSLREYLGNFADEIGRLQMKDALLSALLGVLAGESGLLSDANDPGYTFVSHTADEARPDVTAERFKAMLKEKLYAAAVEKLPMQATEIIGAVCAVTGVLIIVSIMMILYPVIRTLTKIGAKNPGFHLVLPILGGIFPYLNAVILPAAATAAGKWLVSTGRISVPEEAAALIGATNVSYGSGTIVAFAVAIALFIFGFVYGYKRRALDRAYKQVNNVR